MLHDFNSLTEKELEEFANEIKCIELSDDKLNVFYSVESTSRKFIKGRISLILILKPMVVNKDEEYFLDMYSTKELKKYKLSIIITQFGIFNSKKRWFKWVRRTDLEEIFLNYKIKKERKQKLSTAKNLKKFEFGRIRG